MMSEYNVPSEKLYQANDSRYEKMKYNRTGKSGLLLPAISLGLWHNFGFTDNFENSRNILKCAFDTGITHFDLANNYGPPYGSAESTFGAIYKRDFKSYRDELIVSTKAGYDMWPGPYGNLGSRKYLISSLDLDKNTALTDLNCGSNPLLTSLDLTYNTALNYLSCSSNLLLTLLDITNNTNLTELWCNSNPLLTTLDLSNNTALKVFYGPETPFASLDFSNIPALTVLNCSYNPLLTSLNVKNGNNVSLTSFDARNNFLLKCIQVDDEIAANAAEAPYTTWIKDASCIYSEDCSSLSLEDELLSQAVTVYPNPVHDILTIDSQVPLTKVEIYSVFGQKITEIYSGFKTIPTDNLSSGMYVFKIYSENGTAIKKLIKN